MAGHFHSHSQQKMSRRSLGKGRPVAMLGIALFLFPETFGMQNSRLPPPLARATMRAMPAPVLQRVIDILMSRMHKRHSRLFQNLEKLKSATVRINPTDVSHRFVLAFGKKGVSLTVANLEDFVCDAEIKGDLEALLNMLEGRLDGDQLFFSREIEITGKTDVVVALRNTLDREEINLLDDITSPLGPFKQPAQLMVLMADKIAQRVRRYVTE
jgi:O2-independent ubiquinone biosynthesis accessory factor UbiT